MTTDKTHIVVLGAGESGVGAAVLALKIGASVFVSEGGTMKAAYQQQLEALSVPFEVGSHTLAEVLQASLVVKSPGIPEHAPVVQAIRAAHIPIVSEIEFAARYTNKPIIAITGSNGKTTTTLLMHHLMVMADRHWGLGGNVGFSFANMVAEDLHDGYVLEVSSFQLDDVDTFAPHIAMVLNITADHLDRYEYDIRKYGAAKMRIGQFQQAKDLFIYNGDDPLIASFLGTCTLLARKVSILMNAATCKVNGYTFVLNNPALGGPHNRFNAQCAITAALELGIDADRIQTGLDTFVNAAHRLEWAGTLQGVRYVNDSKATNVDAVFYALQAYEGPIVWIVGGQDKGNDYAPLLDLVHEKVSCIVCLGVDNKKLHEVFGHLDIPMIDTKSAKEAVLQSSYHAEDGDVVLLSPACASFDLFKNYEDRGQQFKEAVQDLMLTDANNQLNTETL